MSGSCSNGFEKMSISESRFMIIDGFEIIHDKAIIFN